MLILASGSPRRRELLTAAGIEFTVQTSDIPEEHRAGESPIVFARRLAEEKASAVWKKDTTRLVLGADTIVIVDSEILGKPRDLADAIRMLRLLSGRIHEVTTAVCLRLPAGSTPEKLQAEETTRVHMSAIPDAEISAYVDSGEPMDKAGAYAIQGAASHWIYKIEGDYNNVVGLPVAAVSRMLQQAADPHRGK
jgi:septum formation protein